MGRVAATPEANRHPGRVQDALPRRDRDFGELQAKVEQARAIRESAPREKNAMPDNTDKSARAFQELVRVLEEAVRAGVASVGLEYKGRDLIVFHNVGGVGLGASHISQELQQAVIEELVKRAGLSHKSRGKMRVSLLGRDFEAVVEEYDSFGESAFAVTLKERNKKVGP
jgi:hypothetical protein